MTTTDPCFDALLKLTEDQLLIVAYAKEWVIPKSEELSEEVEFFQDPENVVFFRHIDSQSIKTVSADMLDTAMWNKFIDEDIINTYLNTGDLVLSVVFGANMKPLYVGAVDRDCGTAMVSCNNWAGELEPTELTEIEGKPNRYHLHLKTTTRIPYANPAPENKTTRSEARLHNLLKDCRIVSVKDSAGITLL